ncbi:hypothetical protein Q4543_15055 [Salipiger sp. 1_MG-2023]|uniref:hypothetical protein n=1 Tax=Salipiger sp. 1_MG-2023 TaxID=3062665 RepID=UPI0026E29474|nr:hypothetical protein [Salipiger sp. 1_MG-2023]MDO6586830.1 hypothetical protein [Salipiger sp. 1_MG-2023]
MVARANFFTREDDETLLEMLDRRDRCGMSALATARELGLTKGRVSGSLHRVDRAEAQFAEACAAAQRSVCVCAKAENCDGGMPRGWWRQ